MPELITELPEIIIEFIEITIKGWSYIFISFFYFIKDNIDLLTQLLLAIAAIWYSIETREMRRQNQTQMNFMREQHLQNIQPYLLISENQYNEEGIPYIEAYNPNPDRLVFNVTAIVYEPTVRNFLTSDGGRHLIEPQERVIFHLSSKHYHQEEVRRVIVHHYINCPKKIIDRITIPKEDHRLSLGFSAVFAQDIEGNIYMFKREFQGNKNERVAKKQEVIY